MVEKIRTWMKQDEDRLQVNELHSFIAVIKIVMTGRKRLDQVQNSVVLDSVASNYPII